MVDLNMKYGYGDVFMLPAAISEIDSRSECKPFYNSNFEVMESYDSLPLFTAPMDSVINIDNVHSFINNGIVPIIPRTEDLETRLEYSKKSYWVAYSLSEFEDLFCSITEKNVDTDIRFTNWYNCSFSTTYALIDVANGHMKKIYNLVKKAKELAKNFNYKLVVMVGNIANPETYKEAVKAGIDYVRCSIGSGSTCITATQTGIFHPVASLIDEIYQIKKSYEDSLLTTGISKDEMQLPKIVADGGIRGYSDVIKALALGADYVMCGTLFTKMWESAAPIFNDPAGVIDDAKRREILSEEKMRQLLKNGAVLEKECWGMSTKRSQALIKKGVDDSQLKTSEGTKKIVCVEYTMKQWCENMESYLRSAMSYTGHRTLESFIGSPRMVLVSPSTKESINK